jgi:hypothetical protein
MCDFSPRPLPRGWQSSPLTNTGGNTKANRSLKEKKTAAVKVTQPKHVEEESLIRPMRTIRAIFSTDYLNIESAVISNLILN